MLKDADGIVLNEPEKKKKKKNWKEYTNFTRTMQQQMRQ